MDRNLAIPDAGVPVQRERASGETSAVANGDPLAVKERTTKNCFDATDASYVRVHRLRPHDSADMNTDSDGDSRSSLFSTQD